jgi:hypothetical protein
LIYKVAGEPVPNAEALAKRLQAVEKSSLILINFERGGSPFLIRVRR